MSIHTDGCLAARGTVLCRDFEKTVRINFEGGNELSLTTRHGRDAIQLKFAEQAVITALRPLSFVAVTTCKTDGKRNQTREKTYTGNVTVV